MGKGITNPFETRFQPLIDDIDGERKKLATYAHAVLVPHKSLAKLLKVLDGLCPACYELLAMLLATKLRRGQEEEGLGMALHGQVRGPP